MVAASPEQAFEDARAVDAPDVQRMTSAVALRTMPHSSSVRVT
jgi:hypothetical protein